GPRRKSPITGGEQMCWQTRRPDTAATQHGRFFAFVLPASKSDLRRYRIANLTIIAQTQGERFEIHLIDWWKGEFSLVFFRLGLWQQMDCIFCNLHRSTLAETKLSLALLDSFPVSEGHALIIPKRHVASVWDMTADEYADAFTLVRQVKEL